MAPALLACPAVARAQSAQGAMNVVATILPAPAPLPTPRVTLTVDAMRGAVMHIRIEPARAQHAGAPLLQFARVGEDGRRGAFVTEPKAPDAGLTIRLPADSRPALLHLERLVLAAGT